MYFIWGILFFQYYNWCWKKSIFFIKICCFGEVPCWLSQSRQSDLLIAWAWGTQWRRGAGRLERLAAWLCLARLEKGVQQSPETATVSSHPSPTGPRQCCTGFPAGLSCAVSQPAEHWPRFTGEQWQTPCLAVVWGGTGKCRSCKSFVGFGKGVAQWTAPLAFLLLPWVP